MPNRPDDIFVDETGNVAVTSYAADLPIEQGSLHTIDDEIDWIETLPEEYRVAARQRVEKLAREFNEAFKGLP